MNYNTEIEQEIERIEAKTKGRRCMVMIRNHSGKFADHAPWYGLVEVTTAGGVQVMQRELYAPSIDRLREGILAALRTFGN